MHRRHFFTSAVVALLWVSVAAQDLKLPNAADSLKFAAIGDNGDGGRAQYEVGAQMARYHAAFEYELVIMLGDNMYGRQRPQDFVRKFERPYKPLLDAGVKFYASLGNHDEPTNRFYELWNMGGERYYTYRRKNVRFFALDTNYMDPDQLKWLEDELDGGGDDWKIVYFHHPLYSSGERHGSQVELRESLEPLFIRYGVDVVFSGHDHIYERIRPQNGIHYFVSGAGGKLRRGNIGPSTLTAAGYDRDRSFMLIEVEGDRLHFQAVSRSGQVVDAGAIPKRARPTTTAGRPRP